MCHAIHQYAKINNKYMINYDRTGFELTFKSCIVKNSYKILVLGLPESAPWLGLRIRKC